MNNTIIVWYNPKKRFYYHKFVKGTGYSYNIGDANSYGHYIVYKIQLYKEVRPIKINLKQRIINALLDELEKN